MIKQINGSLTYYKFQNFLEEEIIQGIFTRKGGVSPSPWSSLNTGGLSGDERENVIENRRRIFNALNRSVETIYDVWQVHSNEVVCTDKPRPLDQTHLKADIILTNRPEVTLFMRFADCVPIFLFDPITHVIGIVHAGWQGTLNRAVQAAISKLVEKYKCTPKKIIAGIGPSIGPDHYEIGPEVVDLTIKVFNDDASKILIDKSGKCYMDLWLANQYLLMESGVENIELAGICTACHTEEWFSHRAEKGKTGRFGALLALRP